MKKSGWIFLIVLVAVVGAVVFQLVTGKKETPASIEDMQKKEGIPVNALTLKTSVFERWRTFSGSVEGKEQAVIYANIPARVRSIGAKQGDLIRQGKTLIQMDALSSAQTYSAVNMARIQTEDAQRLYDRMLPLFTAGAISKEEFDQVKSGLAMAKAGYTDAASLTSLRSPIRGTLTDLRVNPGDKVDPGQTLAVVADITGAKVILDVSQTDVDELAIDQPVVLGNEKSARHKNGFEGRIEKISLSADMKTRLFRVEVGIDDMEKIRLGTLRYVQILTYRMESALALPLNAVIEKGGEISVFVVDNDGKSARRVIRTGRSNENSVEVLSGLNAGDTVVVWGQNRLQGGEKLKIVPTDGNDENNSAEAGA